jgi:hypothetical protein
VRVAAVAVLTLTVAADVWNAATVRGRATEAVLGSEADRAPLYATASWCAAACCALVLLAIVLRIRGIVRTPRPVLWFAGLAAIAGSVAVQLGTASMWV